MGEQDALPGVEMARMAVGLLLLAACVLSESLPIYAPESPISLAQVAEEVTGQKHDDVAAVEAQTQKEIEALEAVAQGGSWDSEALAKIENDEKAVATAANKVGKLAKSAESLADGEGPLADVIESQLAESTKLAKKLMATKAAVTTVESAEKKSLADAETSPTLGEAKNDNKNLAEEARLKAAKWIEGQKLAEEVQNGGKGAPEPMGNKASKEEDSRYMSQVVEAEKAAVAKAEMMKKQIDAAGKELNAWYDKHEHDKDEAYLGESTNPVQEKIEQDAVAKIKKIQKEAAKAIEKAGETEKAGKTEKAAPEDVNKHEFDHGININMDGAPDDGAWEAAQTASDGAKQAAEEADAQYKLNDQASDKEGMKREAKKTKKAQTASDGAKQAAEEADAQYKLNDQASDKEGMTQEAKKAKKA